jgi:hypothetical protein
VKNGDYPFKFGTLMGTDAMGNKYYENRVDYPFGQHRWVEPYDIHNFDSSMIPPEWHGWMVSMNDTPPNDEKAMLDSMKTNIMPLCHSDAPFDNAVGYQNPIRNFHFMHNQSQIRSRGYGIGNPVVGLPPGAPDAYYTQPGSPYNDSSRKPLVFIGELDQHRKYKSEKWAHRLRTPEEKLAYENRNTNEQRKSMEAAIANVQRLRMKNLKARGSGTVLAAKN